MKNLIFLFTLLFISSQIIGQDGPSIHFLEYQKYSKFNLEKGHESSSAQDIIPLNAEIEKELSKSVFGYLPYWEYSASKSYLRYDLLTHIALFSFSVSSSGSISNPPGGSWPWTDVINEAHANGVKVVMSVINFNINRDEMHNLLVDSNKRLTFINNVRSKISTYKLDGVNIDFEAANISESDRGNNINNFMRELTDSVHAVSPELEVSYAAPAVNWGGWDLTGLVNSCDYLFVMGYDFYGSWSTVTGPTAPLKSGSPFNVTNTINVEYATASTFYPEKLILGVPYYGPHWITTGSSEGSSIVSYVTAERFRTSQPQSEIYGVNWSTKFDNSWYNYQNGSQHGQVWFDNDSSLSLKYDLAIAQNLKGIGMWALGYDGTRTELWNLISKKFGTGELPTPNIPTNFSVVAIDESSVGISFSNAEHASSYEIYTSSDAYTYYLLQEEFSNGVVISDLDNSYPHYFKVRSKNENGVSFFTEVLASVPSNENKILIVNGFDRTQNTNNNFDLIKQHSQPLINAGMGFSSCSNEAIFNNSVSLNNFDIVFWMLLDESTSDETLNDLEQVKVKAFLENGGNLFISGSEIGWDLYDKGSSTDKNFYNNYLKADYLTDAPNNESAKYYEVESITGSVFDGLSNLSFDNGLNGTIDVDWPDAITARGGASNILKFSGVSESSGVAGIEYTGTFGIGFNSAKLIYLSIPYESIIGEGNRTAVVSKVLDYFGEVVDVNENENVSNNFKLNQNYPNPFNPSTVISYRIPSAGDARNGVELQVNLTVYDVLGRKVTTLVNENQAPGNYEVIFNVNSLGNNLVSGTYLYTLRYGNYFESRKMILIK